MDSHQHLFSLADWPFPDVVNTASFTTDGVLNNGRPILTVSHDEDGDWQFLCDTPDDNRKGLLVCLGCMLELDPSLVLVADLPQGWVAWRDSPGGPWQRQLSVES